MKLLALIILLKSVCISASVQGVVLDKNTGEKIEATLELITNNGSKLQKTKASNFLDLNYQFTGLPSGFSGKVIVQKDGYFDETKVLEIPKTEKYTSFSRDFVLIPKKVSSEIEIASSPFYKGKADLKDGFEVLLKDILIILKKNPTSKFEIIAYPDNKNSKKNLTNDRINKLIDYFYDSGISKKRFKRLPKLNFDSSSISNNASFAEKRASQGKIIFKIISL